MSRMVEAVDFKIERLPKGLQDKFRELYANGSKEPIQYLRPNEIYWGDARHLLPQIEPNSIALSVWSPPYFVGKEYMRHIYLLKIGRTF